MKMKRLGILTSGGDCSGLNSVIRAAYLRAKILGYELIGIKRGLRGLSSDNLNYVVLNDEICNEDLLATSGSIIYSDTKWLKMMIDSGKTLADVKNDVSQGYKKLGLDGLICVGGDGSLSLLSELLIDNKELNLIAVPKTIDNDVEATDFSVGFQTAVEVVTESIQNIRTTAKSHERVMVIEVMGRDAGFIAMYSGIAAGADVILVPEFDYDIEKIKEKARECYSSGKNHCIIVVAEAVKSDDLNHDEEIIDGIVKFSKLKYNGIGENIAGKLKKAGFDSRAVTLGHTQRGGETSIMDRVIGSAFGVEAVNLIDAGNSGRLVCYKDGKITSVLIRDVVANIGKELNKSDMCISIAKSIGVYIGEV